MNSKKIFKKTAKTEALSQIFLLVFGIVAFSYAIGSEVREVSGINPEKAFRTPEYDSSGSQIGTKTYLYREDGWYYTGIGMNDQYVKADNSPAEVQKILKLCVKANVCKAPAAALATSPKESLSVTGLPVGNPTDYPPEYLNYQTQGVDPRVDSTLKSLERDGWAFDESSLKRTANGNVVIIGHHLKNGNLYDSKPPSSVFTIEESGRVAEKTDVTAFQGDSSRDYNAALAKNGGLSVPPPPLPSGGSGKSEGPQAVAVLATALSALKGSQVQMTVGGATKTGILKDGGVAGTHSLFDENGKVISGFENVAPDKISNVNAEGFYPGYGIGFMGNIVEGFAWSIVIAGAISLLGPIFGLDQSLTKSLSEAAIIGTLIGKGVYGGIQQWGSGTANAAGWGIGLGSAVAIIYFLQQYKQEDKKVFQFSCLPWQPPKGGQNCELCNNQEGGLPCSEYQCRSLGQSCEIVNKGMVEEKCVWKNRNDVNPPVISLLQSALLDDNYQYTPDNAILPPDRGAMIEYKSTEDKCIPAFTPLRFGISLDEPARCKIDVLRKDRFDNMSLFMDSGLFGYNHTFSLSLPGKNNLESANITVENDGNYNLFIRCEDTNGNSNIGTFVFKYCVDKGPDTTPPSIVTTSIPNKMPVAFNQSSVNIDVYVNEPAECKWSHNNRDYSSMEGNMSCQTTLGNTNDRGLYTCTTTLDGIKDRFTNKFYFRCKDKPLEPENQRNENVESFEYTIIGTQPLVIDSIKPNDTIKDASSPVRTPFEVKTSAGFDSGKSICYYSATGNENDYVQFFETDSHTHKQDLFLTSGFYIYYIRCIDLGGNRDDEITTFNVDSDNQAPKVARAYHEDTYLKVVTDEDAKCVYDVVDCNYPIEEGTKMTEINGLSHFTDWGIKSNLYIKCSDLYGNQPLPNECSVVVKSTNF